MFATTQPYRYAVYLGRHEDEGGMAKRSEVLQRLILGSDRAERMWALVAQNLTLQGEGDFAGAVELATQAIAIDPTFALAYMNRAGAETGRGRAEAAFQDSRRAAELFRGPGRRHFRAETVADIGRQNDGDVASALGDYATALKLQEEASRASGRDGRRVEIMYARGLLHDITGARRDLALIPPPTALDRRSKADAEANAARMTGGIACYAEDWQGFLDATAGQPGPDASPGTVARWRAQGHPSIAVALARLGRIAEAQALIAGIPLDNYEGLIERGTVAQLSGDRAAADRWFGAAVRTGPSLPFGDFEWGQSLMVRGDAEQAAQHFSRALKLGPRFADAHLGLGDARLALGDASKAESSYRQAAELAPRLRRAQLRWGEALASQGRMSETTAKWRAAAARDLTPLDRAEVRRRLGQS